MNLQPPQIEMLIDSVENYIKYLEENYAYQSTVDAYTKLLNDLRRSQSETIRSSCK